MRRFAGHESGPLSGTVLRIGSAALIACGLGGCSISYQLGKEETTGSVRPVRAGQVDPNPNDPFKVDTPPTSKPTQALAAQHPG